MKEESVNAERPSRPRAYSEEAFESVLRLIATSTGRKIVKIREAGLPSLQALWWRARKEPAFRARLQAAQAKRQGQDGFQPTRYRDEDFDGFIAAVERNPRRPLVEIVRSNKKFPHWETIKHRARTDPRFAAMLKEAMSRRPRHERIELPAPSKDDLNHHLRRNDLFRNIEQAVPRAIEAGRREEIISDLILAALEDRLPREALAQRSLKTFQQYLVRTPHAGLFASLDERIRSHEKDEPWVDTLSTDDIGAFL